MTISLSPTPKLSPCLSSERLPRDVIFGVIAGLQKVYPHFSVMPDGLVHESEKKYRAHFFAHVDPLSDWTISGSTLATCPLKLFCPPPSCLLDSGAGAGHDYTTYIELGCPVLS